jgi:tRNA nucleotidyltransferase (CCA-adding enzyme)
MNDLKTYGVTNNGHAMQIELTEKESKIANVLQGVSALIAKERPELPVIECRIAGGWVRDKVLGRKSGKFVYCSGFMNLFIPIFISF